MKTAYIIFPKKFKVSLGNSILSELLLFPLKFIFFKEKKS